MYIYMNRGSLTSGGWKLGRRLHTSVMGRSTHLLQGSGFRVQGIGCGV